MKTFQADLLEQFEGIATKNGCKLVQVSSWANTGKLVAKNNNPAFRGPSQTVALLTYHFQEGSNSIQFNNFSNGPTQMSARFAEHEDDKINQCLQTWTRLLANGKKAGTMVGLDGQKL